MKRFLNNLLIILLTGNLLAACTGAATPTAPTVVPTDGILAPTNTATLALSDPSISAPLPNTYDYYFRYFVDPKYGEFWNMLDTIDHKPVGDMPKAWPWKSAYHSFEHALVGYITSQQLESQPVTLYYAFVTPAAPESIHSFYLSAAQKTSETSNVQGTTDYKVTFTGVQ